MEKHTVHSYDNELNNLRHSVVQMANLVRELVRIGDQAIKNPAQSFVQLANDTDLKINHHDRDVENLSTHVIALRQPMAIDLRQVIAALKLAVILERMGDLAKKISHRIEFLPIKLAPSLLDLIHEMIAKLDDLLSKVILAYETFDNSLAIDISKQDGIIDEFYIKLMSCLTEEMENKPHETKHLLNIVLIARNLERIGDYITKIAYITHYIVTGDKKIDD
jgi:phosphate transport system protein